MERTQPDPAHEAPRHTIAHYGRGQAHIDAQVRTMLTEMANRLEHNRPDELLTATARLAVLQATTMDPALTSALRVQAPEFAEPITRRAYAARIRDILGANG